MNEFTQSHAAPRRIVILGSTGSIGTQTLDVVRRLGPERAQIVGLAARQNVSLLAQQARETGARYVAVTDETRADELKNALSDQPDVQIGWGDGVLSYLAALPEADTIIVSVSGAAALSATLAGAQNGKRLCIATKEVLVAAGELVMSTARASNADVLPVDSEHSAIFQCLQGLAREDVAKLWLTASGGPFRTWSKERIENATVAEALNHPTWRMGGKITIDSASLMNKALEVIEAVRLFDLPPEAVEVVVHPQSVVHSMVETRDGSLLAQLGLPDMRLPIQVALTHPQKFDIGLPRFNPLAQMSNMTFEPPDYDRFPAIPLARRAMEIGGVAPAVFNAANEIAAHAFLDGKIRFGQIVPLVENAVEFHKPHDANTLEAVLEADDRTRRFVRERLARIGA